MFIVCEKCRLRVLLASLTQQCILAYFPTGSSLLRLKFSGMPVDDGSFGWRWLVSFFRRLNQCELAGDGLAMNRLALARNGCGLQVYPFRLCVLAYRCLHGSAPPYLAETLHLTFDIEACPRLRSGSTSTLSVPATRRSRRSWRPGVSCSGRSASIEHSANSFIIPNVSS